MRLICFVFGCLLATLPALRALAAAPEVAQAETTVSLDLGAMHTQYHENASPGDDESGFTPGFGAGISALLPLRQGWNPDLYTALNYSFNAGNIHYGGHSLFFGTPLSATDNAVFNRVEARVGLGYEFPDDGIELIPYVAAGYQAWNRNINNKGVVGTDEFYHSGFFGGGARLDLPINPSWVASFDGEILALAGGGITSNSLGVSQNFGVSGAQRFSLALDHAINTRLHFKATIFWQHSNFSGSKPQVYNFQDFLVQIHEPLSTTTQFGTSLGLAYSF
jgi:hypothetical protein